MRRIDMKRGEITIVSDDETKVKSDLLTKAMQADPKEVVQHLKEVIGPITASDVSIDQHGVVTIKSHSFGLVAKLSKVSPLDNILCNHHLICG